MKNEEIIVGVNNSSILKGGHEVDIPIIIISNDRIYKYAVEVNGDYWHSMKNKHQSDKEKLIKLKNKGYQLFNILLTCNSEKKKIYGNVDTQVENIIKTITNDILNNK